MYLDPNVGDFSVLCLAFVAYMRTTQPITIKSCSQASDLLSSLMLVLGSLHNCLAKASTSASKTQATVDVRLLF